MIRADFLQSIHRWDVFTFQQIMASRLHRSLIRTARGISRSGDGWVCVLAPLLVVLFGYSSARDFAVTALAACVAERIVYLVAKRGFKRRRPPNVMPDYRSHIVPSDEFSFPSGHTSAAFLIVTLLFLFYGQAYVLMYLWAVAVGASRVILGVHFPTDVLVGAVVGSVVAFAAAMLMIA